MLSNLYKKINLIYIVNTIFAILLISTLFNFIFSFKNFLLINIILIIHYISIIYFIKYENNKYYPIFPLITIFFFSTYTLSFLIGKKDFFYESFNSDILSKSIFILILGLSSFFAGYISVVKFYHIRKKKIFYFTFNNLKKKKIILTLFLILTLLLSFNSNCFSLLNYSFFYQLKEPTILFTFGLILSMVLKKDIKSIVSYILLTIFIFLIFLIEISTGATVFAFSLLIFLFSIYYFYKKKISLFYIFSFILMLIFIHSIKYDLRNAVWKNNLNCIEKFNITKNLISNKIVDNKFLENQTYTNNKNRLFHSINSLNIISKLTPEIIPFYQGQSYETIYTKFIPRDFWENKPNDNQGNFWGHRYRVLLPSDNTTSWNFPVLNEFYANFGMLGVLLGMFLLGLFTKFLILKLYAKNISDLEMLSSSVIIFNLFFLENNLSQILGKIIHQFIFFNFLFFFIYFFFKFISKYIIKSNL